MREVLYFLENDSFYAVFGDSLYGPIVTRSQAFYSIVSCPMMVRPDQWSPWFGSHFYAVCPLLGRAVGGVVVALV